MQAAFEGLPGVVSTTVGYTGGTTKDPSYQDVGSGATGHAEAIQVEYDPDKVRYEALLDVFWHNVDPTDSEGQFCDRGTQYRSAIFYHDEEQKRLAEKSKAEVAKELKVADPIVTAIVPASPFYRAEEYHQDFYRKNPLRYRMLSSERTISSALRCGKRREENTRRGALRNERGWRETRAMSP